MKALDALDHSLHMIKCARVETEPYKHIVIDGIFPADFYLQMLENFPDESLMPMSRPDVRQLDFVPDPGVDRFIDGKLLIDNNLKQSEPEKFAFWSDFRDAYFSQTFCQAFLDKFEGDFDERDLKEFMPIGRIACDLKGAGLGPHRDRDDKICSVLFYLGDRFDPDVAVPFGTMALKSRKPIERGSAHHGFADFEVSKVLTYYPNRMACWAVSRGHTPNESFHAYHQSLDRSRRLIKFFVQRKEDADVIRNDIANTKSSATDWKKDVDSVGLDNPKH